MNEFVEVTEIFQARVNGAYVYHKKGKVLLNKAHIVSVSEVGHEAEAFFVDFFTIGEDEKYMYVDAISAATIAGLRVG